MNKIQALLSTTMKSPLSVNADAKTKRGVTIGYLTGVMYFAHAKTSGVIDVCKDKSPICEAICLDSSGRAEFDPKISEARIKRTLMFAFNKPVFFKALIKGIEALIRKSKRENLIPCIRLNGTSDLPWERIKIRGTNTSYDGLTLIQAFDTVQFYDYTKTLSRLGNTPDNYHLTASYSELMTIDTLNSIIASGHNVAVVFRVCEHKRTCACALPNVWNGIRVISGDANDVRFEDEQGVLVGLKAKGSAKYDHDGFVIRI
jgi:hypothetical protein